MNHINTLLLIFISSLTFGQTPIAGHFFLKDQVVYYEHVFEQPDKSAAEIEASLVQRFGSLAFKISDYSVVPKSVGASGFTLSSFVTDSNHLFDVQLQVKDGRYRVLLTNIRYIWRVSISLNGVNSSDQEVETVESTVINRKGEFKTMFINSMDVYSQTLDNYFNMATFSSIAADDDW